MKPLGYIHTCTGIFENKIFPLKKKQKKTCPHVNAKNEMLANQKPRSLGGKQ